MTDVALYDTTTSPFDKIRHVDEKGEYWLARELMIEIGYRAESSWQTFVKVIEKAKLACRNSGQSVENNFTEVHKVISDSSRGPAAKDYRLSRYACYLVIQNANPTKPEVALGHTYFAVNTRENEIRKSLGSLAFSPYPVKWHKIYDPEFRAKVREKGIREQDFYWYIYDAYLPEVRAKINKVTFLKQYADRTRRVTVEGEKLIAIHQFLTELGLDLTTYAIGELTMLLSVAKDSKEFYELHATHSRYPHPGKDKMIKGKSAIMIGS